MSPADPMTALTPDSPLDALRREIDAIDDAIVDLLVKRFAATARVKEAKSRDGSIASSPFRPAREAAVLRRLLDRSGTGLPANTLVGLWRVIMSSSTQSQAPVILHMSEVLGQDVATRIRVAQHFCGMEIRIHPDTTATFAALRRNPGDLALMAPSADWADPFCKGQAGEAAIIGTLPVTGETGAPALLIFGHADPQQSGNDETILLTPAPPAESSGVLWQARSGSWTVSSLPGFLAADFPPISSLLAGTAGARIAGRSPRPIKV